MLFLVIVSALFVFFAIVWFATNFEEDQQTIGRPRSLMWSILAVINAFSYGFLEDNQWKLIAQPVIVAILMLLVACAVWYGNDDKDLGFISSVKPFAVSDWVCLILTLSSFVTFALSWLVREDFESRQSSIQTSHILAQSAVVMMFWDQFKEAGNEKSEFRSATWWIIGISYAAFLAATTQQDSSQRGIMNLHPIVMCSISSLILVRYRIKQRTIQSPNEIAQTNS